MVDETLNVKDFFGKVVGYLLIRSFTSMVILLEVDDIFSQAFLVELAYLGVDPVGDNHKLV